MEAVKCILLYLRGKPDPHITYSRHNNFEFIGFFDTLYGTGNTEKARPTSGRIFFLSQRVVHFSTNIQMIAA